MRRTTRWSGAAAGALLLAAAIWGFWPSPIAVDVAEAVRGPLRITIDEEGETRVRDRFVVSAPVPGRLLRVDIEPGERVSAGAVVGTLLPAAPAPLDARARAEAEARMAAARAAVDRAIAARDQAATESSAAETELRRHRELDAARLLARDRLEAVETVAMVKASALRAADASVRSARQDLRAAEVVLVSSTPEKPGGGPILLHAPVTGTVLRRLRESESTVPAGEPLLEIGDTAQLEIVSDLLSTDAVKVSPGQAVQLEGWGGRDLCGTVRRVEPGGFTKVSALGVEEQRVNVIIDLDNAPGRAANLGDGYRVEVRIVIWERSDVLKIPISSLFRDGDQWRVFVVEEGKAIAKTVTIGERNSQEAEVLSGLDAGRQVIVHPPDAVEPGAAVRTRTVS